MADLQRLRKLVLDEKTSDKFYGRFTVEPFERGYGHTIGNSLRRILLSSLEGAAVTSVKIEGAPHEFAVLKGVREDAAQIILNLKKLRFKLHSSEHEKLYLNVKKGGRITADDIEKNTSVEIMNIDQEIANLDNDASLQMEIEVSSGKGYVLANDFNSAAYAVGSILLDVLFSPIIKVNYEVENTRVEQTLNYDKLIMEIWTDGSIYPAEALKKAAQILQSSLIIFTGEEENVGQNETSNIATNELESQTDVQSIDRDTISQSEGDDILSSPISALSLSARATKSLKNGGVETVGDLVKLSFEELEKFESLGKRSLDEIEGKLAEHGLSLQSDE